MVKHLTLGNLSDLPDDLIQLIRRRLADDPLPDGEDNFQIVRSLPHGHVAAVLGTLQRIGLDRIISSKPCREAQLAIAMIVLRIIAPASKYGLLCAPIGCPVAIEVFAGNTADPTTFTAQVNKVRKRFGITRLVLVGDRGMITSKRIDEDLREVEGLESPRKRPWMVCMLSAQACCRRRCRRSRRYRPTKTYRKWSGRFVRSRAWI